MNDGARQTDDGDAPESKGSPPIAPGVIDEWVAWNIRLRRENLGMSQADLAQKMAVLGWKYHPQTVHRIESGNRKVTVGEAEALARIFNTTVDSLTWPDMVTHTSAWFILFIERADAAFEQIVAQVRELLFDREHLERALAQVERAGIGEDEFVRERIDDARSVLDNANPEQAVEVGREKYSDWQATAPDSAWDVHRERRFPDRFPRAPWLEATDGES
jgi:transcriptional regulator with XRE-family HTH domain